MTLDYIKDGATMKIQLRTQKGKKIRDFNTVPGVLYGKGLTSTSITANAMEFNKMYRGMGNSKTFEVELDGVKHLVYIKEVQPLPSDLHSARHFDLVKVSLDDTMTAKIRITFINKDEVKKKGLIVNAVNDTVEIEYAVGKGVSRLELDVGALEENDSLNVSDIVLPEGVKIISNLEATVVSAAMPKEVVLEQEEIDEEFEVEETEQEEDEE